MFNNLRVTNFRSIRDSGQLDFSKLNIIIGPNNSGKSSILYILLLLKQTLQDKDFQNVLVTSGPYINLGSYADFVRNHFLDNDIQISFEIEESSEQELFKKNTNKTKTDSNKQSYTLGFDKVLSTIKVKEFSFGTKENPTVSGDSTSGDWILKGIPENIKPHVEVSLLHFIPYLFPKIDGIEKIPQEALSEMSKMNVMQPWEYVFLTKSFQNILYVAPVREHIPPYGILTTSPSNELGPSGQNLVRVLSQIDKKTTLRGPIIKELNYWLGKRFKILKRIKLINIDKTKTIKAIIADEINGTKKINLTSMGSGISQIVPVIVQTVLTPKNGCILIEQPEIHLHPAAQADLADLFIQYANEGRQLIVETHSEHLILRIRRRIAEKKIDPKLVRIFVVRKEKGETKISKFDFQHNGHFSEWPDSFFEEGYKEALALAEAQHKNN